jgi:hypothetical protein
MRNGLGTVALQGILRLSKLSQASLFCLSLCVVTGCDSFQIILVLELDPSSF